MSPHWKLLVVSSPNPIDPAVWALGPTSHFQPLGLHKFDDLKSRLGNSLYVFSVAVLAEKL
jgi:hypothetical protein